MLFGILSSENALEIGIFLMTFEAESVRFALRNWVSGVSVVTTRHHTEDKPIGLTVSSFTSVSLDPPLLLVCLFKETDAAQAIVESGQFAINLLDHTQAHLSTRFAGYDPEFPKGSDRFLGLELLSMAGVPMLKDALASFQCRVKDAHDGSSHYIFVGEVVNVHHQEEHIEPLVYYNRGYHHLTPHE